MSTVGIIPRGEAPSAHPRGLFALSAAEMWERCSFYTLKGILLYFMTDALGYTKPDAQNIQGWYVMAVYAAAIPGGLIADKLLGAWWTVVLGAISIIAGQFTLIGHSEQCFFAGLGLIALGTGLLKPNMTSLVGNLYVKDDPDKERGYALYYVGINIGAFIGPTVGSILAQSQWFKERLTAMGLNPADSWYWAFAFSGVGMIFGLAVFLCRSGHLRRASLKASKQEFRPLNADDLRRVLALVVFFLTTVLFFTIAEQGGSSLSFFAKDSVDRQIGSFEIPAAAFQGINPVFVLVLTPTFGLLWKRLGKKQPASPAKFSMAMLFLGFGSALVVWAALWSRQGPVSPLFLVGFFFLQVMGEVCLSPVGLSKVNELAPPRFTGLATGIWFLAWAIAAKLAGVIAAFCSDDATTLALCFGCFAVASFVASLVLYLLRPKMKRLMGNVL
jgi:POT family proton-dependent oligopeptide transporter